MSTNQIKLISFQKEVINKYENTYNDKNQDKITEYTDIDIFDCSTAIKILQIQPKERLDIFTDEKLVSHNHDLCVKKFKKFFELSFQNKYSLVLTPEYSVPVDNLIDLIDNVEQLKPGTLYCVCCEGMNSTEFTKIENSLKDKKSIEYNNIATASISLQTVVCVMFYITKIRFQTEKGNSIDKVFVVPQFKLTTMRDKYFDFERSGLTQGKSILYLGDNNSSKFISLLCADAYNLEGIKLIEKLGNNELLIFNPQLNTGAENKVFCFMREYLFQYCAENVRIINLNWARDTELNINEERTFIKNPWSGVYFGFQRHQFNSILKSFPNNAFWGLDLGVDNNMGFWFINPNENILSYKIHGFKHSVSPVFINEETSLMAVNMLVYDENADSFSKKECSCTSSIDEFFLKNEEFSLLNHCIKCEHKKECTKCELNKFSALVFDNYLHEEYDMFYGGNYMGITSKQYYDTSNEKIIICKKILNMIKNDNVSQRFKCLDKNFQFVVEEVEGQKFNVIFKTEEGTDIYCRVVYLKFCEEAEAQRRYAELVKNYSKNNRDNIMVFYETDSGCKVIPESNNTNILDDNTTENRNIV